MPANPHSHDWESGRWGVVIGVSACRQCGVVSRDADFLYSPWEDDGWEAADDPEFEGLQ